MSAPVSTKEETVASHKGRCRAARVRPQPTPAAVARRWLRASGARDALPVLTAHPTSLTAEVHFADASEIR